MGTRVRLGRSGMKLHSKVQLLTEHILEVGSVGRPEAWFPQGALCLLKEHFCHPGSPVQMMSTSIPLSDVMFPKEPLMHMGIAGMGSRGEELPLF